MRRRVIDSDRQDTPPADRYGPLRHDIVTTRCDVKRAVHLGREYASGLGAAALLTAPSFCCQMRLDKDARAA